MAMHAPGLEETPFEGWTLSNVRAVGPRLLLAGAGDDLSAKTNFTITNDVITARQGRFHFSGLGSSTTCTAQFNTAVSGDFEYAVDFDALFGLSQQIRLKWLGTDGNRVAVRSQLDSGYAVTNSVTQLAGATGLTTYRCGGLKLKRVGNVWTGYYLDIGTQEWQQIGATYTNAYAANGNICIEIISSTNAVSTWFDNLRNLLPSSTSGTATSPVYDTTLGLDGLSWMQYAGGASSTVTVEYRTASSITGTIGVDAALVSPTSWTTATSGMQFTRSLSRRYMQVRVTLSVPNTSTATPEVGPFVIEGAVDQAFVSLLFRRQMAFFVRHTDANGRLNILSSADATGADADSLWTRVMPGVGRYYANGGSDSITWEGETFNISDYIIPGVTQCFADMAGIAQLTIEAAQFLPGLYVGRDTLLPLIPNATKDSWTASIIAAGTPIFAANYNTFHMVNRCFLSLLEAEDPGHWHSYPDSDLDTWYANAQASYAGDGVWQDSVAGTSEHYDSYASVFTGSYAQIVEARPDYGNAAEMKAIINANRHQYPGMTDGDGRTFTMGRSLNSGVSTGAVFAQLRCARVSTAQWGLARAFLSRGLATLLRDCYIPQLGGYSTGPTRKAATNSTESYTSSSLVNAARVSGFAEFAGTPELFSSEEIPYPGQGESVAIWGGAGKGFVRADADSPMLGIHLKDYDVTTDQNFASKYAGRVTSHRFWQNVNFSNSIPNVQNAFWHGSVTGLSTGNVHWLNRYGSIRLLRCGKSVIGWRTGNLTQFSPTVAGTVGSLPATEIYVAKGRHAQAFAKFGMGTSALNSLAIYTPPVPLPSGASLSNQATTTGANASAYGTNADETLGAYLQILEAPATLTPNSNFVHGSPVNRGNRMGRSVGASGSSLSLTGDVYAGADIALHHDAMTPGDEAAWISGYARSTDAVSYVADDGGTEEEDVYLHFSGATNPTVGSWALTGTAVKGFSGQTGADPQYFGGGDVTAISHADLGDLVTLDAAGNVAVDRSLRASRTTVYTDQGVTVDLDILPVNAGKCVGYDLYGAEVDVTSQCSLSASGFHIPLEVVEATDENGVLLYKFGLSEFDILSSSAPDTPGNPFAEAENGQVTTGADTVSGADTYNLYRGNVLYQEGLASPSYVDTAIVENTTYVYQWTAVNEFGESPRTSQVFVTALPDVTAPTITGASIAADGVTLTLTFSEGVTGTTGLSITADGVTESLTLSGSGLTRTLTLTTPVYAGQTVTRSYAPGDIVDLNGNALAAFSGLGVANNSALGNPNAPGDVTDFNALAGAVTWEAADNAARYEIQRGIAGTWTTITDEATGTSYTDDFEDLDGDLPEGVAVAYRIRAISSGGTAGEWSAVAYDLPGGESELLGEAGAVFELPIGDDKPIEIYLGAGTARDRYEMSTALAAAQAGTVPNPVIRVRRWASRTPLTLSDEGEMEVLNAGQLLVRYSFLGSDTEGQRPGYILFRVEGTREDGTKFTVPSSRGAMWGLLTDSFRS